MPTSTRASKANASKTNAAAANSDAEDSNTGGGLPNNVPALKKMIANNGKTMLNYRTKLDSAKDIIQGQKVEIKDLKTKMATLLSELAALRNKGPTNKVSDQVKGLITTAFKQEVWRRVKFTTPGQLKMHTKMVMNVMEQDDLKLTGDATKDARKLFCTVGCGFWFATTK